MQKLNLGCGENKKDGYINLDCLEVFEPDVLCDITKGLPFKDDYFDEIDAFFVLNLIGGSKDFLFTMNEIWRVLKKDGQLIILVPNALHPEDAFRDPMEARWFVPNTFQHFDYSHSRFNNLKYGFKPWKIISVQSYMETRLHVVMEPYKQ
jgi:predicted SAM-dependent methyltransferase